MVKTLTIRDSVYKKLVARKGKGESFSEFFERLLAGADSNAVQLLAKLQGSVELKDSKAVMLSEIGAKRNERRRQSLH